MFKFKNKHFISYEPENLDRNSKAGLIDSIVEFLLLSKTQLIIGSYYSSFSDEASFFNIIPKITPINNELRTNIKDTINNYHCINYIVVRHVQQRILIFLPMISDYLFVALNLNRYCKTINH